MLIQSYFPLLSILLQDGLFNPQHVGKGQPYSIYTARHTIAISWNYYFIISIRPLGQFGQEPEPTQATGMALVRCIWASS